MTTYHSTSQQAVGRAVLTSINGVGNFLAWTGIDTKQNLNFNFQPKDMTFKKGMISDNGVRCSNYGPDLVVLPDEKTAYIIWADKDNVVKITKMSRTKILDEKKIPNQTKPSAYSWSDWALDGKDIPVLNSNAASGPCAALGHQNGQSVLNVLWQDFDKGVIAFTQLPVFGTSSFESLEMEILQGDLKASSTPALVMEGGRSFLAYFDKDKQFNLAIDPLGGLSFTSHYSIKGVTSNFSPAFLPIASGQAYLFWVDDKTTKLHYQQIGTVAKHGGWALNPTKGCGGTVSEALPSGAPSVQSMSIENPDTHVMEKKFRVAWPDDKERGVHAHTVRYTSDVAINHAAMPVVIVTAS